jgi:hypothetical protein
MLEANSGLLQPMGSYNLSMCSAATHRLAAPAATAAIQPDPIEGRSQCALESPLRRSERGPRVLDSSPPARSSRASPGGPHPAQLQCASNLARATQPPPVYRDGKPEYRKRDTSSEETDFSVNNPFDLRAAVASNRVLEG